MRLTEPLLVVLRIGGLRAAGRVVDLVEVDLAGVDLAGERLARAPLPEPPLELRPFELLEAAVRFAIPHTVVGFHHTSHSRHTNHGVK